MMVKHDKPVGYWSTRILDKVDFGGFRIFDTSHLPNTILGHLVKAGPSSKITTLLDCQSHLSVPFGPPPVAEDLDDREVPLPKRPG